MIRNPLVPPPPPPCAGRLATGARGARPRSQPLAALALWCLLTQLLPAQTSDAPWRYSLVHGATLTDDCPVCDRPALVLPLRGSFDLRLLDTNPLFTTYALEDIRFSAGHEGGPRYTVSGTGEYRVGGEVALTRQLTLKLVVDDGSGPQHAALAGDHAPLERLPPMIHASAKQTDGTDFRQLDIVLAAAPFRDLWFSTVHGMTSGTTPPPFEHFRPSEVLAIDGRRVLSNAALTRAFGIMPIVPDIGLDAIDARPGGEIAFSATQPVFSETLGEMLQPGDVLSDHGRILHRHRDLIAPFAPMPPIVDFGLDAIHDQDKQGLVFSIGTDFFSERLGVVIRRGDLLSSDGSVVRTAARLLERFHPVDDGGTPAEAPGLDAVFVWPSGEIWFSTESGFADRVLGPVHGGDLLSDSGYIVFKNLELVSAFSPLEDLADFGLDALVVVTDTLAPLPPPATVSLNLRPESSGWRLEWTGDGRFFQVLGATAAGGPYLPLAPIQSNRALERTGWLSAHPDYFFRVRQW